MRKREKYKKCETCDNWACYFRPFYPYKQKDTKEPSWFISVPKMDKRFFHKVKYIKIIGCSRWKRKKEVGK